MDNKTKPAFTFLLILLFGLLLLGHMWLGSYLWPRKPIPPVEPAQVNRSPEQVKPAQKPATPEKPPSVEKPAIPPKPEEMIAPGLRQEVILGTEGGHLRVTLDPRGAGVRQVILNDFQEADALGRPVNKPAQLVPGDSKNGPASFLLYHYRNPTEDDFPLDTLGQRFWKRIEPPQLAQGQMTQRAAFQTTVRGVRITKTYTLEPRWYHIGLEVRLELDDPNATGEKEFRYQLQGAHGLPIEGEWYTSTLRQALIARVSAKNEVERYYQDVRQISAMGGGTDVVAGDASLRYAGVAVQYFASVIAVDTRDQADTNFLAQSRPLLLQSATRCTIAGNSPENDAILVTDAQGTRLKDAEGAPLKFFFTQPDRDRAQFEPLMRPGTEVVVVHRLDMPLLGKPRQVITDILDADRNVPLFHDDITVAVSTPRDRARVVKLKPKGDPVVHKYVLYNGPVKVAQLNQLTLHHEVDGVPAGGPAVDPALVTFYHDDLHLDTLTDYRAPGPVSEWLKWTPWTSIIIWCTNRLHWLLWQLHRILPVYGLCIVLLTVLVRGAMFPVSRKQALTSIRMQELAPELKKLHEKYKGDRQAMGTAQMELYRKHGVNPFGSCWLILLQMPVFLGLYFALQESIHFRLAPFLWIENLAAPDMLIRWGESIPWISLPRDYGGWLYLGPYFNLLPVIAVILMLMQQKLTMPPPTDEQTAMQMKMMKYMMIFMGLMFYKIASGLCIYFIASSLWGFAERKLLPRRKMIGPDGTEQPVPPSLWQKMRQRLRTARAGSSRTPLAGAITPRPDGNVVVRGAGPAGEPQASPPRGKKKHTRERRKGERRPEGGSAALSSADGPVRRVRGWWTEARDKMRHWWTELLKQAEKK